MITLYYAPDNASLVVRMTLEEAGLPHETRLVDRRAQEQRGDAYRRLNPNGLIPTAIIDGEPVFETGAILLALSERVEGLAPPPGHADRGRFLKWLFFVATTLHGDLRQAFYSTDHVGADPAALAALRAQVVPRITSRVDMLEAAMAERPGPYLLGDAPSAVDLYAACCLRWAQIYPKADPVGLDLTARPALLAMVRALETRPGVARACAGDGIAAPFFSRPTHADPAEGSAV